MKAIRNPSHVEWVLYPDERHGWSRVKTNIDFGTRAERLLARTLSPAPGTTPAAKAAQIRPAP